MIPSSQTGVHIGASTKKAIATGVQFPLSDDALSGLQQLQRGSVTYVQLVRLKAREARNAYGSILSQ